MRTLLTTALSASLLAAGLFSQPLLADNHAGHTGMPADSHLQIENPWSRAMPAVAKTGAAYMLINNQGDSEDTLLSASTPAAGHVELHEHVHEDGLMKMRQLPQISIPAGGQVAFRPGGYHVMLFDLQQPLDAGSQFPLTLNFARAGEQTVSVQVRHADEHNTSSHHSGH